MFFLINFFKVKFRGTPWGIALTALLIIILGLFNLYSASGGSLTPDRFYNQIVFCIVGFLLAFIIGVFFEFKTIEDLTIPIYIVVCILLLLVDFFGTTSKGGERWISLGPVRLQPSEFAKIAVLLIIARSFQNTYIVGEFSLFSLWKQALLVSIPVLLIVKQPDLGTASFVFLIACFQIATLPINRRTLLIVFGVGLSIALLAWNFVLYDYQKQRVLTFINPMLDPRGSGYQSLQSMIAVGSGRFSGLGFGEGAQAKLKFLPERHTDFAFSVWAEEQGFVGCVFVIILYALLIVQIFQVANRAKDSFSSLIAVGVGAFFILHFVINISMVLGIFPVVGVPLSLFSYGGTHVITALGSLGLLIAIERRRYIGLMT